MFELLRETNFFGIVHSNAEGGIIEANDTMLNLLGYTRHDLQQGKLKWTEITPPEFLYLDENALKEAADGEFFTPFEKVCRHKDGHRVPVIIGGSRIKQDPDEFITFVVDITARKKIEEELHSQSEIITNMVEGACLVRSSDSKIVYTNPALEKMFGYNPGELSGKHVSILNAPTDIDPQETSAKILRQLKIHGIWSGEICNIKKDGSIFWCFTNISIYHHALHGEVHVSVKTDITERKVAEKELLESEKRYRSLVESAPICIHQIDARGNIMSMNRAGLKMINITDEQEIVGAPYLYAVCKEDRNRIKKLMDEAFEGKFSEFEFRGDAGVEFSSNFVPIHETNGRVDRLLGLTQDITVRKRMERELSYRASHDGLTGLINRYEFEHRVEQLIPGISQVNAEHALCFMDLDQFKVVNDTCGHIAGDELLHQLGHILQENVRQRDTLARLGGDEFGVLMEHCSLEQAHSRVTSLQQAIQDFQFSWEGQSFHIGVSIGLVAINETTANLTQIMKQADAACYMAKESGRNRIHIYRPEDTEMAQRHGEMQWVSRINHALQENRFVLYAQSIIPLHKSTDRHYELLLRMLDEDGNIIPPGAFLPAAERYGLMDKLDIWVIQKAFALIAEYPAVAKQIEFISINLSGQSVTNINYLDLVVGQIDAFKIDAKKICFEVTETAAISNLNAATRFISTLRGMGCRFALDDFGSGLSSFGYLKNLPVDYLKIDGMFVKDMVDDPIDHAMVKSINDIGHVMGMKTVAEFVETDEIRRALIEIGVDYGQGYYIDEPKPFVEILEVSIRNTVSVAG